MISTVTWNVDWCARILQAKKLGENNIFTICVSRINLHFSMLHHLTNNNKISLCIYFYSICRQNNSWSLFIASTNGMSISTGPFHFTISHSVHNTQCSELVLATFQITNNSKIKTKQRTLTIFGYQANFMISSQKLSICL